MLGADGQNFFVGKKILRGDERRSFGPIMLLPPHGPGYVSILRQQLQCVWRFKEQEVNIYIYN